VEGDPTFTICSLARLNPGTPTNMPGDRHVWSPAPPNCGKLLAKLKTPHVKLYISLI